MPLFLNRAHSKVLEVLLLLFTVLLATDEVCAETDYEWLRGLREVSADQALQRLKGKLEGLPSLKDASGKSCDGDCLQRAFLQVADHSTITPESAMKVLGLAAKTEARWGPEIPQFQGVALQVAPTIWQRFPGMRTAVQQQTEPLLLQHLERYPLPIPGEEYRDVSAPVIPAKLKSLVSDHARMLSRVEPSQRIRFFENFLERLWSIELRLAFYMGIIASPAAFSAGGLEPFLEWIRQRSFKLHRSLNAMSWLVTAQNDAGMIDRGSAGACEDFIDALIEVFQIANKEDTLAALGFLEQKIRTIEQIPAWAFRRGLEQLLDHGELITHLSAQSKSADETIRTRSTSLLKLVASIRKQLPALRVASTQETARCVDLFLGGNPPPPKQNPPSQ